MARASVSVTTTLRLVLADILAIVSIGAEIQIRNTVMRAGLSAEGDRHGIVPFLPPQALDAWGAVERLQIGAEPLLGCAWCTRDGGTAWRHPDGGHPGDRDLLHLAAWTPHRCAHRASGR